MRNHSDKLLEARGLVQAGRIAEAKPLLMRALQKNGGGPATAAMCQLLSQILLQSGENEPALYYAERAAANAPKDADLIVYQSSVLWAMGRGEDAMKAARRAIDEAPGSRNARGNYINFLMREERFAEALAAAELAMERFPNDSEFLSIRATMLLNVGRPEPAVEMLRQAVEREPGNFKLLGSLGPALNYLPDVKPEELVSVHRAFAAAIRAAVPPFAAPVWPRPQDPERPLRIGFLSPDLRRHPMYHFIYPMLAHLDRASFERFCYFTAAREDDASARLKAAMAPVTWRHVPTLNVAKLAELIRSDKIDILIDFAGHTRFQRLGTMMLKAAPVQMNFTGYPCTTGIPETDYHVTDGHCSPPGSEAFFVERLLKVDPIFFCYHPPEPDEIPDVTPCPRNESGVVTFGSFSTLMKQNKRVVAAWARILNAVPGSRLLLKNIQLMQPGVRKLTEERLVAAGIPADRLVILGHEGGVKDHLGTYSKVDICLDTFPYAGMTTTCESLLMGVPTVSIAQRTFASRVGRSILANVGLEDLVAETEEGYVELAVKLAGDAPRLSTLRNTLRGALLASPICDERGYAARFGARLRDSWREWCAAK